MHPPIDGNDVQLIVILQDGDVVQRVPINQNAVRVVPRLYLAKFVVAHQEGGDASGCGNDALVGGEPKELDKMF